MAEKIKDDGGTPITAPSWYIPVLLHERYGMGPEYWHNIMADRRQYWLQIAAIEGEFAGEWHEEGGDEGEIFMAEYEYGIEDDDDA